MLENKTYNTTNCNGSTIKGVKVFKTLARTISRFYIKDIGIISYLFDTETNITHIWLNIDTLDYDDTTLLRLHINNIVCENTIHSYVKDYLTTHNIKLSNSISTYATQTDTHIGLDTVVEYVNYQGNVIVTFCDKWFDVNLISLEVMNKNNIMKFDILETYFYGTDDEDDKLIEVIGFIDHLLEKQEQNYPIMISDIIQ